MKHGGKRPGAGRPSVLGKTSSVTLDVPRVLLRRVEAKAKAAGVSRSEWIRRAIAQALSRDTPD